MSTYTYIDILNFTNDYFEIIPYVQNLQYENINKYDEYDSI